MQFKNRLIDLLVLGFIGSAMLLLLIFPNEMSEGVSDGLMICGNVLIPSLFAFSALSIFLFESGIIEKNLKSHFSFALTIFLLSALGGYPIGAKIISQAYNNGILKRESSEDLLMVCVNAGPAFILTVVGKNILGSSQLGILLLAAHLLSSFEMLLFIKHKLPKQDIHNFGKEKNTLAQSFVSSVASACTSMIGICSYVILFSGIINLLRTFGKDVELIISFLEITNAVLINKNIYLITFFLGFSGICIIMQIISICSDFLTKPYKIFLGRIIHGLLSVVNLKVLLLIFPATVETLSNNIIFNYKTATNNTMGGLLLIILAITFINSLDNKRYCGKIIKDIW